MRVTPIMQNSCKKQNKPSFEGQGKLTVKLVDLASDKGKRLFEGFLKPLDAFVLHGVSKEKAETGIVQMLQQLGILTFKKEFARVGKTAIVEADAAIFSEAGLTRAGIDSIELRGGALKENLVTKASVEIQQGARHSAISAPYVSVSGKQAEGCGTISATKFHAVGAVVTGHVNAKEAAFIGSTNTAGINVENELLLVNGSKTKGIKAKEATLYDTSELHGGQVETVSAKTNSLVQETTGKALRVEGVSRAVETAFDQIQLSENARVFGGKTGFISNNNKGRVVGTAVDGAVYNHQEGVLRYVKAKEIFNTENAKAIYVDCELLRNRADAQVHGGYARNILNEGNGLVSDVVCEVADTSGSSRLKDVTVRERLTTRGDSVVENSNVKEMKCSDDSKGIGIKAEKVTLMDSSWISGSEAKKVILFDSSEASYLKVENLSMTHEAGVSDIEATGTVLAECSKSDVINLDRIKAKKIETYRYTRAANLEAEELVFEGHTMLSGVIKGKIKKMSRNVTIEPGTQFDEAAMKSLPWHIRLRQHKNYSLFKA